MDREEMIKTLDRDFLLTDWQEDEKNGRGYRLCLRASWSFPGLDVRKIQVQLVGIEPLTGENVEAENIVATFSFDQKEYKSKTILTYHGKFFLRCTAFMGNGEQLEFRKKEIMLEFPQNKPEIVYSVNVVQGFRLIEIRSNCWGSCRGKLWITIDGHDQRINIPAGTDKVVRFYISPEGKLDRLRVQGNEVTIRQER